MGGYPRCPVSAAHVRTSLKFEEEEDMPRIVHIAIKVDDLEKATKFYEDVFGFRQTGTGYARGHVSRHLTDGNIDLALMTYDSEDVEEAAFRPRSMHSSLGHRSRGSRQLCRQNQGQRRYDHFQTWRGRVKIPRARRHGCRNCGSWSLQEEGGEGACMTGGHYP